MQYSGCAESWGMSSHSWEVENVDLSCLALAAWALAAAEEALEQSLAICPEMQQKRHRSLSRWH